MAEVVGVVAVATQLATTCLSLIELPQRIKGSSSSVKEYGSQLWETKLPSESITKNKLLQTPEVEVQTLSILTLVNDNDLTPLIKKGRFLRTCDILYKSPDLSEAFVTLKGAKQTSPWFFTIYKPRHFIRFVQTSTRRLNVFKSNVREPTFS